MEYHVMAFEECPRCSQFETDHKFRNCGFTMTTLGGGNTLQEFECSRCQFKWERKYESSSNNRPAFRREARQLELFEPHREILP